MSKAARCVTRQPPASLTTVPPPPANISYGLLTVEPTAFRRADSASDLGDGDDASAIGICWNTTSPRRHG